MFASLPVLAEIFLNAFKRVACESSRYKPKASFHYQDGTSSFCSIVENTATFNIVILNLQWQLKRTVLFHVLISSPDFHMVDFVILFIETPLTPKYIFIAIPISILPNSFVVNSLVHNSPIMMKS